MSHVYNPSVSADFGPNYNSLEGEERPNPIYDRGSISAGSADTLKLSGGDPLRTIPHSLLKYGGRISGRISADFCPNYEYYEGVVNSTRYAPNPYTLEDSDFAPRLSALEAENADSEAPRGINDLGLKGNTVILDALRVAEPSVYQGLLSRLLDIVRGSISAQIGPDSLVTETVGCHSEAADSYGDSKVDQYWYPFDFTGEMGPRG